MSETRSWRNIPDKNAPLPPTVAVVYIKNAATTPAKRSGKPMLTLELQILGPETVPVPGAGVVAVAGRELRHWITFGDNKRSYEDAELLGSQLVWENGQMPDDIDPAEIPARLATLVGKVMSGVTIASEPEYMTDAAGNNILDPITGQPTIKRYNLRLKNVGPAVSPQSLGLS